MPANPITLLLTNSVDYISDLIVDSLGTGQVYRYNSDLWREYKLRFTADTFELENAANRRVTDGDIVKVYRRSSLRTSEMFPDRPFTPEERYLEEELWTAWNDIVNLFHAAGKVVLVQPYAAV